MNFLHFVKWIPAGLALTILLNTAFSKIINASVGVSLWLVAALSISIAAVLWVIEENGF